MADQLPPAPPPDDHERIEVVIGTLLRAGVLLSAMVVLLGAGVYLYRHGLEPVEDRTVFHPQPPEFSRPLAILQAAGSLQGRALIQLGLLLLIATPVARVAFSAYAFLRQRDYLYLIFTFVVLAVLLYSLFSGKAE
jgi:uncharacterized membrane protein